MKRVGKMNTTFETPAAVLPDLSLMMKVGQLRYIQSRRESGELKNPDDLVWKFLSWSQRWSCLWRGGILLNHLRTDPFYYYLVARTKHYDDCFAEAVRDGFTRIVNVGCGSDTRAYRFASMLTANNVRVLECDQASAIVAKQTIARRQLQVDHVDYLPIDLNETTWPALQGWLAAGATEKTLVMMEGVTPYVNEASFTAFLEMLKRSLAPGSRLAYDFKISGVDDRFGLNDRTNQPFRLPLDECRVKAFHAALGYETVRLESGADLSRRLLPTLAAANRPAFKNDALLKTVLAAS
jgi:methyltransferase (TIGR00027 family)